MFDESSLAPYAMKSSQSRGRKFKEPEHSYRSAYQRDRDRIIHTTAFRRLEYKTQVFVNHEGDHYRTRLTHTIEVSQIARTIARTMLLNEDLVETIALAHDLGHTPFGHSGEDALKEIMKDCGGFDHNIQGLRVVDLLEERYPEFKGLNLTYEVREGIAKHRTSYDMPPSVAEFDIKESPTLEAQVVDISDEIAYFSHDLDDGLSSGILQDEGLLQLEIWKEVAAAISRKYGAALDFQHRKYLAIRMLINIFVTDLIEQSSQRIKGRNINSVEDARRCSSRVMDFSDGITHKKEQLKKYLFENFYNNYRVMRMASKAKRFIKELFDVYYNDPKILPPSYSERASDAVQLRIAICDFIAGMTDRYALEEYKKLFDPYERV